MKRKLQDSLKQLFSTRNLTMMAMLIAAQIVLSRYVGFYITETNRFAPLELIPYALAGMWLGPVSGALVAIIADILGTILGGYGVYFAPITLGPLVFAVLCGVGTRNLFHCDLSGTKDMVEVMAVVAVAGFINSFLIGPITTTWYQMFVVGREDTFWALWSANMILRSWTKPVTLVITTIAVPVLNRAAYKPVVRQILRRAS